MTLLNSGASAIEPKALAEARSAIRKARQHHSYLEIGEACGLSPKFLQLVTSKKRGLTRASASQIERGLARLGAPAKSKAKPSAPLDLDALRRDVRMALSERFGGNIDVLARAVALDVGRVKAFLDGAPEVASRYARKFYPFRGSAPAAVQKTEAVQSAPKRELAKSDVLERYGRLPPKRALLDHYGGGPRVSVDVRAVVTEVKIAAEHDREAMALVRKWGAQAIDLVLREAEGEM